MGLRRARAYGLTGLRAYGLTGLRACGLAGLRAYGLTGLRACGLAGLRACGLAGADQGGGGAATAVTRRSSSDPPVRPSARAPTALTRPRRRRPSRGEAGRDGAAPRRWVGEPVRAVVTAAEHTGRFVRPGLGPRHDGGPGSPASRPWPSGGPGRPANPKRRSARPGRPREPPPQSRPRGHQVQPDHYDDQESSWQHHDHHHDRDHHQEQQVPPSSRQRRQEPRAHPPVTRAPRQDAANGPAGCPSPPVGVTERFSWPDRPTEALSLYNLGYACLRPRRPVLQALTSTRPPTLPGTSARGAVHAASPGRP